MSKKFSCLLIAALLLLQTIWVDGTQVRAEAETLQTEETSLTEYGDPVSENTDDTDAGEITENTDDVDTNETSQNTDEVIANDVPKDTDKSILDETPEEINETDEIVEEVPEITPSATGLEINETNFPDVNFRTAVSRFDTDKDGYLSDSEIDSVTNISIADKKISDLTGIKHFKNLTILYCPRNQLSYIDVSGMQNLEEIRYNDNEGLTTLDFRNCPNLRIAYHSKFQEVVYISAGMTKYIGCHIIPEHTGNVVIDFRGYYTSQPDGSKTINLKSLISPELLAIFTQKEQPNYDVNTGILTIPAGEGKIQYEAGHDDDRNPTYWTFYTDIVNVDYVVVTFNSNGGTVVSAQTIPKGSQAVEPTAPTKEGFTFAGWFKDEALTERWDFSTSITEDLRLHAKWQQNGDNGNGDNGNGDNGNGDNGNSDNGNSEKDNVIITFNSNGGTDVAPQTIKKGEKATEPKAPTKNSFTFAGWFQDEALKQRWDFSTTITENMTLYAKWQKVDSTQSGGGQSNQNKNNATQGKTFAPKTGDDSVQMTVIYTLMILISAFVLIHVTRKSKHHKA